MKHPTLVRVFSIVLTIMCVIMLGGGASGFGKAAKERDERAAEAQRYEERIETYRQTDEKLAGSISYEDAYKVLEEMLEEHDDEASQHKTDLAEYSAKKGGYKMAAALMDDAKLELAAAKAQVEDGKQQLAEKEEQLKFLTDLYENNKGLVADGISTAANGKVECGAEAARLQAVVDKLNALIAAEPKAPEAPTEPTKVDEPTPVEKPADESDSEKMEEYNRYLEQKAAYEKYVADKAEYDKKLEEYNTEFEKYKTEHDDWEKQCAEVRAEANFSQSAQVLRSQAGALEALGNEISAALPPEIAGSGIGAEIGAGILKQIDRLDGMDESAMSNEEFLSNAGTLISALSQISGGYGAAGDALSSIDSKIAEAVGAIEQAKAQLAYAEEMVKKGEAELQTQLANLWYNMGELDKDGERLEEEKGKLDEEASELSKQLLDTDEIKELENKRASMRILLTKPASVKAAVEAGGDVAESAGTYLTAYRSETQRLYTGRMIMCALAVLGALAGFAGMSAAFEKTKKRFWLIAPVVLCLVCACAADGISMYLGLGQMYTVIAAAIFAAVQLAAALPKAKT